MNETERVYIFRFHFCSALALLEWKIYSNFLTDFHYVGLGGDGMTSKGGPWGGGAGGPPGGASAGGGANPYHHQGPSPFHQGGAPGTPSSIHPQTVDSSIIRV